MNLIPKRFYLDDIFDDLMISKKEQMKCDIYEKDGNYHIEIDLPGVEKKDISIQTNNGYLIVSACKEEENNIEDKNYIRRERNCGTYERSFYLGELDEQNIDAEFKNGTLKVIVPKKEEIENKKTIEIK